MKVGARSAMIKTAEQSGIPWSHNTEELQQSAEASTSIGPVLRMYAVIYSLQLSDLHRTVHLPSEDVVVLPSKLKTVSSETKGLSCLV